MTRTTWFTALLLLGSGILLTQTLWLNPPARMAPLWVLLPTVTLLLLQLSRDVRPCLFSRLPVPHKPGALLGASLHLEAEPERGTGRATPEKRQRRELRMMVWIAFLAGAIYLVGLLLAVTMFLVPYLRAEAGVGWRRSLLITAATVGVIYLVFGVLAEVPFPEGIIF